MILPQLRGGFFFFALPRLQKSFTGESGCMRRFGSRNGTLHKRAVLVMLFSDHFIFAGKKAHYVAVTAYFSQLNIRTTSSSPIAATSISEMVRTFQRVGARLS